MSHLLPFVKDIMQRRAAAVPWHRIIPLFQSFDYWVVPGPWALPKAMVWRPFGAFCRWKLCEPQRGDIG